MFFKCVKIVAIFIAISLFPVLSLSSTKIKNNAKITKTTNNANNVYNHKDLWSGIIGETPPNDLNLGMFTLHFSSQSRHDDRWNNMLLGGTYKGIFVGTLLNSFSDRAFVFGIQRQIYKANLFDYHSFYMRLGYRLGVITGYDSRMSKVAEYIPAIPIPQVYVDFSYHSMVLEFTWVGIVVTGGFAISF